MAANGIELMSTKLITPAVVTCGNGNAGIRFPSTKTKREIWRQAVQANGGRCGRGTDTGGGGRRKIALGHKQALQHVGNGLVALFGDKILIQGCDRLGAFADTRDDVTSNSDLRQFPALLVYAGGIRVRSGRRRLSIGAYPQRHADHEFDRNGPSKQLASTHSSSILYTESSRLRSSGE